MSYQNRRFGAFGSSENPEELGSTVRGFIIGAGILIVYAANHFLHIELTPENVTSFATDLGFLITQCVIAYGVVKKFSIWAIDKWNNRTV